MIKIRQWFQNQRLYKKLMYMILVAWFMILGVCMGMWYFAYHSFNELLCDKTEQIYISLTDKVENVIDELNELTLSMIGDRSLQEKLIALNNSVLNSEKWRDNKRAAQEQILNYVANNKFNEFSIYIKDQSIYGELSQIEDLEEFHQMAQEAKGEMNITVKENKIFLIRQIRQLQKYTDLATIIGEIDIGHVLNDSKKMFQKSGIYLNMSVFIENTCVYYDDESIKLLQGDGWEIVDDNFIVQCTNKRGWKYLFYTSYKEVLGSVRTVFTALLASSVVFILLILVICNYLLKKLCCQLDRVVIKFDNYSKGILPTREEAQEYQDRRDEIGYLNSQFIEMVYKHKALEEENLARILLHKEAQYKQLQQQIRPHFIFNTLSQITWMAYQRNENELAELSNALSKLIRGSIAFDEKAITVREELMLVEAYMYIQQIRYGNRIEFHINVPAELENVLIPQMTIQPIVENAVTYALEDMLEVCLIKVSGMLKDNTAIFVVEDNGEGIDEDILEKLQNKKVKPKGNGIGLLNVQQRIQILFTEEYGLSFHRVGEHTQVWITVPYNGNIQDS